MSLLDDIRQLDPEPELLNTFEKKAAVACKKSVDSIIQRMKSDIQQRKYAIHSTYKQWTGTLPLIVYMYDSEYTHHDELWEISYDGECAYGVGYVFYKYGTYFQENADYLLKLVVQKLEHEGFVCNIDKKVEEYSKGFFKVRTWGRIGYSITLSIKW